MAEENRRRWENRLATFGIPVKHVVRNSIPQMHAEVIATSAAVSLAGILTALTFIKHIIPEFANLAIDIGTVGYVLNTRRRLTFWKDFYHY